MIDFKRTAAQHNIDPDYVKMVAGINEELLGSAADDKACIVPMLRQGAGLLNWIKVNHKSELPKDRVFLSLWKGAICLTEFDDEEGRFYLCMFPASMAGIMQVAQEREGKFTHWCELTKPEDY